MKYLIRLVFFFLILPGSFPLLAQSESQETSRKIEDHPQLSRIIDGKIDPQLIPTINVFNAFSGYYMSHYNTDPEMVGILLEYELGLQDVNSIEFIDALKQYLIFAPSYVKDQKIKICSDQEFRNTENLRFAISRFNELSRSTEVLAVDYFIETIGQVVGVANLQKIISWSEATFKQGMNIYEMENDEYLTEKYTNASEYLDDICSNLN